MDNFSRERESSYREEKEMETEASGTYYKVYMSFRGADIWQGFADVLYEHMDRARIDPGFQR